MNKPEKTNLGVRPLGRSDEVSPVVQAEVAHLKAKGEAMRRACAMFSGVERGAALRQVTLAFAESGKQRARFERMFREVGLSF